MLKRQRIIGAVESPGMDFAYHLDSSNPTCEPGFLSYTDGDGQPCTAGSSADCLPDDLHLALGSPLVDAGDPEVLDPDGSRSDIGAFGGPDADLWDVDGDGWYDYFWPGTIDDAPDDFDPADWDCDDLDAEVHGCVLSDVRWQNTWRAPAF